jgi:hypothetical protein
MKEEITSHGEGSRAALQVGCRMWRSVLSGISEDETAHVTSEHSPDRQVTPIANEAANRTQRRLANVRYQFRPNGEQRCGICTRISVTADSCISLNVPISSEGWCVLWGRKTQPATGEIIALSETPHNLLMAGPPAD